MIHSPVYEGAPGTAAYFDACDREDAILSRENVRAWVDEIANHFSFFEGDFVLRGVGGGGERLVGALSYVGTFRGEIATRQTDYSGRKVILVFTAAVSSLGLDTVAGQCRALGAESVEALGCAMAFEERQTKFIDLLRVVDKCAVTAI